MAKNARELFQAGKLADAIQTLGAELRDNPTDAKRRTFLFELLCFAGEFDRAEKQLDVLSDGGKQAELGAMLYRAALHAERLRQSMFAKRDFPTSTQGHTVTGTFNGKPFQALGDADPRIGSRLEVFAAGDYLWLPIEHLASIELRAPTRLRDLLWSPAIVRTGPEFKGRDLGEVLLPVLCPESWRSGDDAVRLGRATVWETNAEGEEVPMGQKMLLIDGEEVPILELRKIEFTAAQAAP